MSQKSPTTLVVCESIHGNFHYHLTHLYSSGAKALCGANIMPTSIPISAWGVVTHLKEHYCNRCKMESERE